MLILVIFFIFLFFFLLIVELHEKKHVFFNYRPNNK
jgi:hypothetical protein